MSNFNTTTSTIAHDAMSITPNDSADLPTAVRALLFITAGSVRILTLANRDITLSATFPVGYILPVGAKRVFSTGTTATVMGLV